MRIDSEFACEVVAVTEVLPHPNADRLEIAHFAMRSGPAAYTCVTGKGDFAPGDLAVYCSVDCIVPLSRPEFAFLRARLDGKSKTHYRLKAARLRGVYSEGLLVRAPVGAALGDEIAESWGVEYYTPPQRNQPMNGPTPPSPKKDWRCDLIPEFGVTSLRKAPALFDPEDVVVITEKIHGTNFRFGWVRAPGLFGGWHWVVGSHRTFKTDNRPWYRRLFSRWRPKKGWYDSDVWLQAADSFGGLKDKCWDFRGQMFYGELFGVTPSGQKIQDLTYGRERMSLVLFDAYDPVRGEYLSWNDVRIAAADMELDLPPELYVGTYPGLEKVKELAEGPSLLCSNQIREGVVVRSFTGSEIGKWVGEGYRLRKNQE